MIAFSRQSLSRQFLLASFPIILIGMLFVGWWVGELIERGVTNRLGWITGHYVESFVSPHLQELAKGESISGEHRAALGALLTQTPLGKKVVAFKIWDRKGRVVYSNDAALVGRTFPIGEGLGSALAGAVHSEVSHLKGEENVLESRKWSRLIETYSPIHADRIGTVIAAAEFYQPTDDLDREIRAAQRRSWLTVAAAMLGMYALIFGIVRRGSQTIDAQRRQLNDKVTELQQMVDQNSQLHENLRRAAVRTTALNERFLRRISSDLHDGPGQDLALALMRFESLYRTPGGTAAKEDLSTIHTAMQSALEDLRSISLGLQLPEIDQLSADEIAGRAVRDFERKTNVKVALTTAGDVFDISLPVKITVYRVIQESLANAFRHSGATNQYVVLSTSGGRLNLTIGDNGMGFDPDSTDLAGHFGLEGMRERVEILGGSFQVQTAPHEGTVVRVSLPQRVQGVDDE